MKNELPIPSAVESAAKSMVRLKPRGKLAIARITVGAGAVLLAYAAMPFLLPGVLLWIAGGIGQAMTASGGHTQIGISWITVAACIGPGASLVALFGGPGAILRILAIPAFCFHCVTIWLVFWPHGG